MGLDTKKGSLIVAELTHRCARFVVQNVKTKTTPSRHFGESGGITGCRRGGSEGRCDMVDSLLRLQWHFFFGRDVTSNWNASETGHRYDVTPDWNASWCSEQDGTATRKWIERKTTFDAEDDTTSNFPCNRHDSWAYSNSRLERQSVLCSGRQRTWALPGFSCTQ